MIEYEQQLYTIIDNAFQQGASDIHLSAGRYPVFRIDGSIVPFAQGSVLNSKNLDDVVKILMDETQEAEFREKKSLGFSYTYQNKIRLRVHAYFQFGIVAVAMRVIPSGILSFEELRLPSVVSSFADYKQGIVFVTGPTGSGKSTTLSCIIEKINQERAEHIITLEKPIEHIFIPSKSIIDQREIGIDTLSFEDAFTDLFHQDPDIVMIGDITNLQALAIAMNIAETGHLVFVTLHTNSASQTIDRIINSFDGQAQAQVRSQLALTLVGVASQRLVPSIIGGRVPAVEILFANPAVRNLIRSNKTQDIDMVIETGAEQGMISMNRALTDLIAAGLVSTEVAQLYSYKDGIEGGGGSLSEYFNK